MLKWYLEFCNSAWEYCYGINKRNYLTSNYSIIFIIIFNLSCENDNFAERKLTKTISKAEYPLIDFTYKKG